ncbi:MAG: hypothetical protein CL679_03560 [Bermanella sp.]|nr:hypothetical protein [Bermanella sp.]|tara:strand:+ start:419 stop:2059 length:1641 start_codon:yes stop_codon:yes gene_type:complete
MNQNSNISVSINLVRKELEATLQKAENYFSQFSESLDASHLKLFADEINLARGTFKLLELPGAESLATEMLSLVGDGAVKQAIKLDVLGQSLIGLTQYINILMEQEADHPILLVPAINQVRKVGGHKPITESHFFNVNLRPKLPSVDKPNFNIKPHLPRIRLMFQAGLLRVLKDQNPVIGFKLIQRALELLERGLRGTMAWPFWWCSLAAVKAMAEEEYDLTLARRMLFARIDLLMRTMIKNGVKIFTTQTANELHKDLLHIISLSSAQDEQIEQVKLAYSIRSHVTEQQLKTERKLLSGPDIGSFDTLAKAFKEEIHGVKEALDAAEKGTLSNNEFEELTLRLQRMSNVLKVIHHDALGQRIEDQLSSIVALTGMPNEQKVIALAGIADALLEVELASDKFGRQTSVSSKQEIIGAGHYFEARIVLFDEIHSGLAVSKRAIASFVDTSDKLHLANIGQALVGVKGALIFLNELQCAEIIKMSIRYLEERVLNSDQPADEARLEVLADVLTSIEYYIETVSQSDVSAKDILSLAIKSIAQLGYKVA